MGKNQFCKNHSGPNFERALWFNFRRLGFCNSFNFSSLSVGVEDFADFFTNVPVPFVRIPTVEGGCCSVGS
jgi:hypothetical protein